jgi:hypothetical protein
LSAEQPGGATQLTLTEWIGLSDLERNLLQQMASEAIQDFQAGRMQPIDELH